MRFIICIMCLAVCEGSWFRLDLGVHKDVGRRDKTAVATNHCNSEDDCQDGKCCATHSRDLSRRGRCMSLGRNRDRCNLPEAKLEYYGGKFASHCPCQEEFICDTGRNENGIRRCTARPDELEEHHEPQEKQQGPSDNACAYCELHC